jgi:hypothetical protein
MSSYHSTTQNCVRISKFTLYPYLHPRKKIEMDLASFPQPPLVFNPDLPPTIPISTYHTIPLPPSLIEPGPPSQYINTRSCIKPNCQQSAETLDCQRQHPHLRPRCVQKKKKYHLPSSPYPALSLYEGRKRMINHPHPGAQSHNTAPC